MSTFLNSVSSVTVILLLTAAGYYLAWRGYLKEEGKNFLSKLLLRLCIPCLVISNFQAYFTVESLREMSTGLLVSFLLLIIQTLFALLAGKLLRLSRKQSGVFLVMSAYCNSMFVGYPMCRQIFGDACTVYVMVYYLASMVLLQVVGNGAIRYSGGSGKLFSKDIFLKILTTPAILAVAAASLLMLFDVRLPEIVLSAAKYMSNCVTPLSLIMTGYIIYTIGLKDLRFDKTLSVSLLLRFLLAPALTLLSCRLFGIEGLFRSVLVVMSAMPSPAQTVVFASEYGADEALAARGVAMSTLLNFAVIPLLMLLLNTL